MNKKLIHILIANKDDKTRERVVKIEQYWSTIDKSNRKRKTNSTYLKAFVLSSEQLVLCQRLRFHAGLLTYVILHNIEASSGLLVDIQNATERDAPGLKTKILVSLR